MYDIIIIGAGPAGLTAALYALRANKKILVLESKTCGGKIINASKIENYPGIKEVSGYDYINTLLEQVKSYGCEIKIETVLKVDENKKVFTNKNEYEGKSVIIATGSTNRKLNIENETEFLGKGVSYCATCDGNFFKNKTVAVIGGGDSALEDATYLSNIVDKLYLIHRNSDFKINENKINQLKTMKNVEILTNTQVIKLIGSDKLSSIEIKDNNGDLSTISVDGLFIAIGQEPKNEIFRNVVDFDDKGYIKSEDGVHTKTKGIYVAGDTREKDLRQLTTAVSDGSIAATTAIKELQ